MRTPNIKVTKKKWVYEENLIDNPVKTTFLAYHHFHPYKLFLQEHEVGRVERLLKSGDKDNSRGRDRRTYSLRPNIPIMTLVYFPIFY